MDKNSTLDNLRNHLLQKKKEERQQMEDLTRRELEKLGKSLCGVANRELNIIENAMQARITQMSQSLKASLSKTRREAQALQSEMGKMWIQPALIGLSLFLGIFLGSWGLMQFLAYRIQDRTQVLAQTESRIENERQTLHLLRNKTWGVTLYQAEQGRFVVFPLGTKPEVSWQVGGRPALKLSGR